MLNLNLISQEDKDTFRYLLWRRIVLWLGGAVSAGILVFITLLVPSFLFLSFQQKEILRELAVEEETLKTLGIEGTERRISLLNEKTKRIRVFADNGDSASGSLETLASRAGSVAIDTAKIDFSAGTIEIAGRAPTRNTLLTFERALEESDFVKDVAAPLSDLVKLTDVVFTLKGGLK